MAGGGFHVIRVKRTGEGSIVLHAILLLKLTVKISLTISVEAA